MEKQFTLASSDGGLDAAFSLEATEFKQLVYDTKSAWSALGGDMYDLQGSERRLGRVPPLALCRP
jgi:sialic acid synthase SpsE